MQVPEFIKEVVWSFFPPRYLQLANKPFRKSLGYMSRVLLIAFVIAGLLFIPKLFTLKDTTESELSKFEHFTVSSNVTQSDRITIPKHNPWVVVDLNANLTLTKEIIVIDKDTVKYRFLGIKSIPREQLKDVSGNRPGVSRFVAAMILLMLPGIALLLYIRAWLKYFLLIFVMGTFVFIVMELSKLRLSWKQMLNIASHALTAVIFIEVVSAAIATTYLIPVLRFLGVSIYAITTAVFVFMMIVGVVGYHIEARRRRR
jgi:hypothetical protein